MKIRTGEAGCCMLTDRQRDESTRHNLPQGSHNDENYKYYLLACVALGSSQKVMLHTLEQARLSVYVMRETSPILSLNAGNGKFNTQDKE